MSYAKPFKHDQVFEIGAYYKAESSDGGTKYFKILNKRQNRNDFTEYLGLFDTDQPCINNCTNRWKDRGDICMKTKRGLRMHCFTGLSWGAKKVSKLEGMMKVGE